MRTFVAGMFVAAIAAIGCSGGSGGSIQPSEVDDYFRDKYCDYLVRCGLAEDHDVCVASNIGITFSGADALQAAVDAGTVTWNGQAAALCYGHAFAPASCVINSGLELIDACYDIAHGTVEAGGECAVDAQCVSGTCDVAACPDACCQGTCAAGEPPQALHLGDACSVDVAGNCVGGTRCLDGVCSAKSGVGGACGSTSLDCEPGLRCETMVCVAVPSTGETCTNDCELVGDSCHDGTCQARGFAGAACVSRGDCGQFYNCTNNVCTERSHIGGPCTGSSDCLELGYCDQMSGTCAGPKPDGAQCLVNAECESQDCLDTGVCGTAAVCI